MRPSQINIIHFFPALIILIANPWVMMIALIIIGLQKTIELIFLHENELTIILKEKVFPKFLIAIALIFVYIVHNKLQTDTNKSLQLLPLLEKSVSNVKQGIDKVIYVFAAIMLAFLLTPIARYFIPQHFSSKDMYSEYSSISSTISAYTFAVLFLYFVVSMMGLKFSELQYMPQYLLLSAVTLFISSIFKRLSATR